MMTKNNDPKPTAGRMKDKGVTAISDYLKPNMPLPQYLPYARFLLDTDLCHTAKMLYTLVARPCDTLPEKQLGGRAGTHLCDLSAF